MKLKFIIVNILLIISAHNLFSQQFPINFDSDSLNIAKKNIEKWNGKIISTQCKITQIEFGPQYKPYYKCNLDNENYIWVGSLMNDKDIKIDETLRILGFFSDFDKEDQISPKYNSDQFHLLAFAVLNLTHKKAYFLPGTEDQFNEWKNGIIKQEK